MPKFLLAVGRVFRPIVYLALRSRRNAIGSRRQASHAAIGRFSGRVWARPITPLTGQRFDELDADFEPTEHFSEIRRRAERREQSSNLARLPISSIAADFGPDVIERADSTKIGCDKVSSWNNPLRFRSLVGRPKSGRRQLKEVTVGVAEINAMSAA